jgi:hypothetical protein
MGHLVLMSIGYVKKNKGFVECVSRSSGRKQERTKA